MDVEEAKTYLTLFEVECDLGGGKANHRKVLETMLTAIDPEELDEFFGDMMKRVVMASAHQVDDGVAPVLASGANGLLYGIVIGVAMERALHQVTVGDDELAFLESIEPEEDPGES